jgi:hydroxymethylbilane synthase
MTLTIGSRGSKLALWQANHIKAALEGSGHECRIEIISTSGDRIQNVPLKEVGNKGLFTKEIEEALLEGRIDVAVHSLKDMPTRLPDGLQITATPAREDARDVMIGRKLADLAEGAHVGTGSLRRMAQLYAHRPDLKIESIRGNVDTRIRKLDEGQFDAIVLAAAGLNRLGWSDRIAEYIAVEVLCPAVGQGALAIETRAEGEAMQACLALNHAETNAAIGAERGVLEMLGGGCQVPVGAYATISQGTLHLLAIVIAPDGTKLVRREADGPMSDAVRIGHEVGRELLESGGREILKSVAG